MRLIPPRPATPPSLHRSIATRPRLGEQRVLQAVRRVEALYWEIIGVPSMRQQTGGRASAWWNYLLRRSHIEVMYAAELDTGRHGSAFATSDEVWFRLGLV